MRIAVSGAAGTGKSTLAAALAAKLGVPLVPDFVEEVLREHGKDSWRGINDTRIRKTIRMVALERKIAAESVAEAFVSDKSVVDYLAYWVMNQMEFETKEQNQAVLDMVRAHVGRYTHRLFLPYRADVEPGPTRNADLVHNMKLSAVKRGLYIELGAAPAEVPYTFGEDIDAWVAEHLEGGKAAPAAKKKVAAGKKKKG